MIIIIDSDVIHMVNDSGQFYINVICRGDQVISRQLLFTDTHSNESMLIVSSTTEDKIAKIFEHIISILKGWQGANIVIDISHID